MASAAPFAKMNGLGNEIIVADMRGRADRVTPAAAIALNADPATKFDQIMAIHDPRTPGTANYIEIINSDGSMAQACGNGMRCVVQALAAETGQKLFTFETVAGILNAEEHRRRLDLRRHGRAALRLAGHSAGRGIPRHPHDRAADRADRRAGAALAVGRLSMGNPHAIFWVDRDVWTYELDRFGPLLENHPIFPERANISIAQVTAPDAITIRTWERGAGLTTRLRLGRLRGAPSVRRAPGRTGREVTVTVPGGDLLDRMARRRPRHHDRPGRVGIFRHASTRRRARGRATPRAPPDGASRSSPSAAG